MKQRIRIDTSCGAHGAGMPSSHLHCFPPSLICQGGSMKGRGENKEEEKRRKGGSYK